jgi:hypothetical protein
MFYVGVDLAQVRDYTAIAVVEELGKGKGKTYQVRHLTRMKDLPYPAIVAAIKSLMVELEWMPEGVGTQLVVDQTGVGRPVVDLLKASRLRPIAISITGGDKASCDPNDNKSWRVPKRDLVTNLLVLSQSEKLKIAKEIPEAQTLANELLNLHVTIDPRTAHDGYAAWRENQHDDLVFAVSLALWWAENRPSPPVSVTPVVMCG